MGVLHSKDPIFGARFGAPCFQGKLPPKPRFIGARHRQRYQTELEAKAQSFLMHFQDGLLDAFLPLPGFKRDFRFAMAG